jgi:NADPH-dependent glutamate synthase beta subunit-like oxidoreductase
MPAFPSEVDKAEEEGVKMNFLVSPKKIMGKDGKVTSLECIRMKLGNPDKTGRRRPIPIEGSAYVIQLDTILLALGQFVDSSFFPKGIDMTVLETIKTRCGEER